ncbi:sodium/calcium exchanger regulatory protein 1-like [Saccostrea echinata]|uniref:sodium/calcium exchanger regulatory protein 1-like n=1 Tax=Saccostrea echinata TaxID=191078 RepID=UPI002A82029A|nr:sodium/calcium exchanger regulatory protein 1-like [Saccostrea echinata]
MSEFIGKWKVVAEENLDEIFQAFGVDDEMRSKAKEGIIQPIQDINIIDGEYFIKTTIGHLSTEVRFKLGVTFPSSSMDGKKIMVTYRMNGNALEEVQQYGDHEALISRVVNGKELVSTITGKGKKAIIRYTRV